MIGDAGPPSSASSPSLTDSRGQALRRQVPVICLVTDRRRLPAPAEENLVRLVESASAAGVTMVQIRESGLDDRRLLALAERLVAAAGPSTLTVVNDRTDVAIAAGAGGVHLRSDSASADRVRAISPPGFVIGRSVHTPGEVAGAAAAGADYAVVGTIFASRSKPAGAPIAGAEFLARACRSVRIPLLAIGGVTTDNLPAVAGAGAAGIAAIGLFADAFSSDAARMRDNLEAIVGSIRRAFAAGPQRHDGTGM